MSDYRRLYQPGGSYFFTIVTHQRIKMFSLPDNMIRLKSGFDKVMKRHPFIMEAFVILPDHIHCIWRMPAGDSNYSIRWRLIKSYYSEGLNSPVNKWGEKDESTPSLCLLESADRHSIRVLHQTTISSSSLIKPFIASDVFSFRHKGIIADESQNFIFRTPVLQGGPSEPGPWDPPVLESSRNPSGAYPVQA